MSDVKSIRDALIGLVGVSKPEELDMMEETLRMFGAVPAVEKEKMSKAVQALKGNVVAHRINCATDMGFAYAYGSRRLAEQAVDDADWVGIAGLSLENAKKCGMVSIEMVEVVV